MKVNVGRAITFLALIAVSACSNEAHQLTGPSLSKPRLDLGTEGTAAIVCVSGDSPAGNYTFTVSNVVYAAGGSTVPAPSSAIVAKGSCFALVTRLQADVDPDPVTTITYSYSSNDVVGGAGYSSTTCDDDSGIPGSNPCGTTVVGHVNIAAGTTATFSFVSSVQKIEDLRDAVSNLDISKAAKHELDDRLRDASKEAGKGHNKGACNQVDQFIKKLNDLSKKKIEDADAAKLRTDAEEIQDILGCK